MRETCSKGHDRDLEKPSFSSIGYNSYVQYACRGSWSKVGGGLDLILEDTRLSTTPSTIVGPVVAS